MINDNKNHNNWSRRLFLKRTGGAVLTAAVLPLIGCEFNEVTAFGEGTNLSFITSIDDHYTTNGGEGLIDNWAEPNIIQNDWQLQINGLVSNPMTLNFADLAQFTAISALKTMRCVFDSPQHPSGGRNQISTAVWSGISLKEMLELAGVDQTNTKRIRFYGSDGFYNNIKAEKIFEDQGDGFVVPFIATHVNGQVLPREHGFPARLIVPDEYGFKNVKWITRIEASDVDETFGQYQDIYGFSDDGEIQVVNKVTNPLINATIPAGAITVSGHAVSGAAGIDKVEVSVDGGDYQEVRIVPEEDLILSFPEIRETIQVTDTNGFAYPYRSVWALWEFDWDATPGAHEILVRATDRAGNTQPESDLDPNNGVTTIFKLSVNVQG